MAAGDGIGPEITDSTLAILNAAGAGLKYDFIEVGEKVYLSGETSGISQVRIGDESSTSQTKIHIYAI